MASKSAAKMKPVPKKEDLRPMRPIEEAFEEAKKMFVLTVETQVKTARRVDNLMNIRDFCDRFWGDDPSKKDLSYYKDMQDLSVSTYEKIAEIAKTFDLVDFRAVEVRDYFEDLIPKVENIHTMQQLCEAALVFMSVQPYGGKLIQLHQLMQDECAKRDILD